MTIFYRGTLESILTNCITEPSHPSHHLVALLTSGRRYQRIHDRSASLCNSFYPQAIRTLNTQEKHRLLLHQLNPSSKAKHILTYTELHQPLSFLGLSLHYFWTIFLDHILYPVYFLNYYIYYHPYMAHSADPILYINLIYWKHHINVQCSMQERTIIAPKHIQQ